MGFLSNEILRGVAGEAVGEKYHISYPYGGTFENVLSIDTISGENIVFILKNGKLILTGENMRIRSFCGADVTVEGRIFSVIRCK